jgi:hypothetical protein
MPFSLICYNGHSFTVGDEFAGRKVACPFCELTVPVPEPPKSPPPPRTEPVNDGKAPAQAAGRTAEDEEAKPDFLEPVAVPVARGLAWHSARLIFYLLCILALIVVIIPTVGQVVKPEVLDQTVWAVLVGCLFAGPALGIAGSCLAYLAMPRGPETRTLLIASLITDFVTIGAGAVLFVLEQPLALAGPMPILSWFVFILFLRGLAIHLDQPDYIHEAVVLLVKGASLLVLGGLLFSLWWAVHWFAVLRALDPEVAHGIEIGFCLVTITWLVFLIRLLLSNLELLRILRRIIRPEE